VCDKVFIGRDVTGNVLRQGNVKKNLHFVVVRAKG